ncbi:hypothetical protein AB8A21_12880 [Streptomyces sp. BF23-18]|uniref:hypothetical protein n=1 Tax=Streptomyces sp. BF23-18 TaxID=3240282 RepID=UPI0034E5E3C4
MSARQEGGALGQGKGGTSHAQRVARRGGNLVKVRFALHEVAQRSVQFVKQLGVGRRCRILLRPVELSAGLGAPVCVRP